MNLFYGFYVRQKMCDKYISLIIYKNVICMVLRFDIMYEILL